VIGSLSTEVDAARRHDGQARVRDAARRDGPGLDRHWRRIEDEDEDVRGVNDIFFSFEEGRAG
jgi:hypothetical protein